MIVAASGRRYCAMPVYERFSKRLDENRGCKLAFLYAEYVEACRARRERPYAYSTFCSRLRAWRRELAKSRNPEWFPGEYMRTYWSPMAPQDGAGGKALVLFVAQLEYGDATFVCRSDDMGVKSWMRCCESAFAWFGGVPYVTDCSMCKISKTAQATIEAFARHYGTVLYGARPKSAKTAEASQKPFEARNSSFVLRQVRQSLEGLGDLPAEDIDVVIEEKVRTSNSIAVGGRSRMEVLEEVELPKMLELPATGADMAMWSTRLVRSDHHFTLMGVRYSAPYALVGERVKVAWTDEWVRAYFDGKIVADHLRAPACEGRCTVTDDAHRPPGHRWFADRMKHRFVPPAREVGPNTVKAMRALLTACKREKSGYRRCKELLNLRNVPSGTGLEGACAELLASGGDITVEAVRGIMEGGA